jgi:hypothetical protein
MLMSDDFIDHFHDRTTKCAYKKKHHVVHVADLLVVNVQCRGASGVVGSGECRFPRRILWITVAGFHRGANGCKLFTKFA